MSFKVEGIVISRSDVETGEGKNGMWQKRVFVIETGGEYPKKIAFEAWGDKVDVVNQLTRKEQITVSFSAESREYNNRWYTTNKAFKIERKNAVTQPVQQAQQPAPQPAKDAENDDLPF